VIPFWSSIPAITAVLCGGCIFAFCKSLRTFQKFLGFTLIFDGLFILLESMISLESSSFSTVLYLLYVAMMLSSPFCYYFATKYLLKEEGTSVKDLWMLEVVAIFLIAGAIVLPKVRTLPSESFLVVLFAIDDAAFIFFLLEQLFVQVFCLKSLSSYKKKLDDYYSTRSGKSVEIITVIIILVIARLILYIGINFFPAIAGTFAYHVIQTVLFSLFFVIIAIFTCRIRFTAEELGNMLKKAVAAPPQEKQPSGNDFIKAKLDRLIQEKFFLNPEVDLMAVSAEIHVNYKYITEYLKYNYSETFMIFVNRLRIEYSESLLKDKNIAIPDIAEQSGFISESTYYRNFTKLRGITPSKFRKML